MLAVGGMAALYKASSQARGTVAVKLLHRQLVHMADIRTRFLREGKLTMAMNHPGIPQVYGIHELPDGTIALEMELLSGETVQQRVERRGGYLGPLEVLAIADGILGVLAVAHGRGVIHRDVKPENVFLTSRGELKLLDFGIARARETISESLTLAGHTLGTPAFMAPEQARGQWDRVDARTDIWAVGATMFAALMGRGPHERPVMFDALVAATKEPAPKIATLMPNLKPAIALVIDRALERDPADRWPDAATMRDAVREAWRSVASGASMQKVWDHIAADVVVTEPKTDATRQSIPDIIATLPRALLPKAAPAPDPPEASAAATPAAPPPRAAPRTKSKRDASARSAKKTETREPKPTAAPAPSAARGSPTLFYVLTVPAFGLSVLLGWVIGKLLMG